MNSRQEIRIRAIFAGLAEEIGEPKGELDWGTPFQLLVAVILSAQATDAGVNAATPALFQAAPDPQSMIELGAEGIYEFVKKIGLARGKSQNIFKTSRILLDEHAGQVPETFEELIKLPGVGPKTANVVLNVAFGQPVIAVDTHVFRVAHRLGLSSNPRPEKVSEELEKIIPADLLLNSHHYLLLHGRRICKAQRPECSNCKISKFCIQKH